MIRVLQAARLSRLGDAATGLDKQDEAAHRYAAVHGHAIVATAADADVSGSVSPWERPKLGPYLTDPKLIDQYDEIVAATLDRLGRNARHLAKLRDWCEDNGKALVVVSPSLRWPPTADDLASGVIWDVLARLAEYELAAITKRVGETRKYLQRNNFLTGRPPWGFRVVPSGDHKTLAVDPDREPYLRAMVDRYLDGATLQDLATWLESEGVPAAMGARWTSTSVGQILRNPCLIGRRKDSKGRTELRFDPVLDLRTWGRLQTTLAARARKKGGVPPADTAMLTGIAACGKCGSRMYRVLSGNKRKDGSVYRIAYYRCHGKNGEPSTCRNMVRVDALDAWVDDWFTSADFGQREVLERVVEPGETHDAELDEIAQDMADLVADSDALSDDDFMERMAGLRAERTRLLNLPAAPDTVRFEPTGIRLAELWSTLDSQQKRKHLLGVDIKIHAHRSPSGQLITRMTGDINTVLGFGFPGFDVDELPESTASPDITESG